MFDDLQAAAKTLAYAEGVLRQAEVTLSEANHQRLAVAERVAAKRAAITEARQIRAQRTLTEQEAAQFNLDLMDLEDLQGLQAVANGPVTAAQAKVNSAQTNVNRHRAHLNHLTEEKRLQGLVACAVELEQRFCAALQEAFDVARNIKERTTMRDLWTPTSELQNVVNHNRSPKGQF